MLQNDNLKVEEKKDLMNNKLSMSSSSLLPTVDSKIANNFNPVIGVKAQDKMINEKTINDLKQSNQIAKNAIEKNIKPQMNKVNNGNTPATATTPTNNNNFARNNNNNNNNNNNKNNMNKNNNQNKKIQQNPNNNNNQAKKIENNKKFQASDSYKSYNNNQHQNYFENANNEMAYNEMNNFDETFKKEKKFTGRCRLFVGNLPGDMNEADFKELFSKFGEVGEVFLNPSRSFGFIKLDTRINAEQAKQELDGITFKNRCIRVRFASHGAAVRVKNLSPFISNEFLEQAFSIFGPVERAVVIVDDKGRPTGEGIVEFERKPAAAQCINKCNDTCFLLTNYPKPVIVEPLEQRDDEDGMPEKTIIKTPQFYQERESQPRFVQPGSFEYNLAIKWKELYEQEKQFSEEVKKRVDETKEQLEFEIEQSLFDHKTMLLKEDLRRRQEELERFEDFRKSEFQRRQEMDLRRKNDDRGRNDDILNRQNNDEIIPRGIDNRHNQKSEIANQHQHSSMASSQPGQVPGNNRRFDHRNQHNQNQYNTNNNRSVSPSQAIMNQISAPHMFAAAAAAAIAASAQRNNLDMGENNFPDRRRQFNDNRRVGSIMGEGVRDESYQGFERKRPRY